MRVKATATSPESSARAAYEGRTHAVGTIAFAAEADLSAVAEVASALFRAFTPSAGFRVRVSRGTRSENLPRPFNRSASVSAAQLARGGRVELSTVDFEVDPLAIPSFWVQSRAIDGDAFSIDDEVDEPPRVLGFCLARPTSGTAAVAIGEAMHAIVEAAADVEGCVSAIATAQGRPLRWSDPLLPFEAMVEVDAEARKERWLRRHVRSPAWSALLPHACVKRLGKPPPSVTTSDATAGVVVKLAAENPFAVDDFSELETWLAPVLPKPPRATR